MAVITSMSGYGDVSTAPASQTIPDAAVLTGTNVVGKVYGDNPSMYLPYVSQNTAAEIVAEGAEIKEGEAAANQLAIQTQKVAVLQVFTNESAARSTGTPNTVGGEGGQITTLLSTSLQRALITKANAILWQNPAPAEGKPESKPTGLFNYPGTIQGGTITNKLDPIVDAIAQISTNGGTPTTLVMNYGTWAYLLKLRDGDGTLVIAPDVANAPAPQLFGLTVRLDTMAPDNKILVYGPQDVYSSVSDVAGARTTDRYFERDSFAVRFTFRFGWGIPYPDHLAVVPVNTGTDNGTTTNITDVKIEAKK